jgi:hypothetical protein
MESFMSVNKSKDRKIVTSLFLALTIQLSILSVGLSHVTVLTSIIQTANAQAGDAVKPYENEKFGLTMSYPSNWAVHEFRNDPAAPHNNSIVVAFNSQPEDENDKFVQSVYLMVQGPNNNIKSLEQYTANSLKAFENLTNAKIEETGKDTLAGLPATQIVFTTTLQEVDQKKMQVFTVINNNTAYVATFAAEASEYNDSLPDFEKMINSIKIDRAAIQNVAENQSQPTTS